MKKIFHEQTSFYLYDSYSNWLSATKSNTKPMNSFFTGMLFLKFVETIAQKIIK